MGLDVRRRISYYMSKIRALNSFEDFSDLDPAYVSGGSSLLKHFV